MKEVEIADAAEAPSFISTEECVPTQFTQGPQTAVARHPPGTSIANCRPKSVGINQEECMIALPA